MTKTIYSLAILVALYCGLTAFFSPTLSNDDKSLKFLSEYGFFDGQLTDLQPVAGVIPYELNSPLFSDYAHKARFIRLPEGKTVPYNEEQVLDFPEGTAIIKTFFYYHDERKPEKGRRLMETRVLLNEGGEWKALPYIWNDEQTDAKLRVIGGKKDVEWRDEKGKKRKLTYHIPNVNECKGCHAYDKAIRPIGPSARQLNGDFDYTNGAENQLLHWQKANLISDLPDLKKVPKLTDWADETQPLNDRARGYLDANCGHCHNAHGPANTSGMFLNSAETDLAKLGVEKAPIAAGRGSGDRKYGIQPGQPDESIMVYRMESTDPGVMMPEISRALVHEEGVALIREWIENM